MPRPLCLLLLTLSFLAVHSPAHCQSADFVPVLSGNKYPLTLKLKDLDNTWRQMSVSKASAEAVSSIAVAQGVMLTQTLLAPAPYYTRGETAGIGGEIFLVAYRRVLIPGGPVVLTPGTVLILSLINLRQLASLDGIQPYIPQTAEETAQLQQQALEDTSEFNLKQLGLALIQYTQDNDEQLPPMMSASVAVTALNPFVRNADTFEQPQTHEMYQPNTSLSHRSVATFADPASMVIYYEPSPAPDGKRAVLFLDGHVKRVEESEWQRLKVASHIPKPAARVQ